MTIDTDGLARYEMSWEIEGAQGNRKGYLHELHEGELENARADVRRMAKRGNTVTIKVS